MANKMSQRSGVALIIVLGLVAILMIISVAFAIHMRVERAGAANLRHAAVARQIVKGAMAAAIAAIDEDVEDEIVAPWYDEDNVENLVYKRTEKWLKGNGSYETRTTNFWKGTLVAYDLNALEHVIAHFPAEVDDYLPYGFKYRSFANRYVPQGNNTGGIPIIQPEWLPVFSDTDNDSVVGRYSYFVLDTTGLLDANAQYGTETRNLGRHTAELRTVPAIAKIPKDKQGTYVNIAELEKINDKQLKGLSNIWWNTFSYEPGDNPTNKLIDIGVDATVLRRNKEAIISAFYDLGLTASSYGYNNHGQAKRSEQACWAYLGLVDYVDEDNEMEEDLDIKPSERPATERMPLVSGFFADLTIEAKHTWTRPSAEAEWVKNAPVQVKFSANVKVPFVFPFLPDTFNAADRQGLTLEGKAALIVSAKGGNSSSDKETVSISSPAEPDECIVENILLNAQNDQGWVNVMRANNNVVNTPVADQLKLPNVFAFLRVGGATKRGGKIQHSFPVGEDNYRDFDEDMGMVVQFRPEAEGVAFNENDAPQPPPNSNAPTYERTWKTNLLVWAEIVDPRFANKSMSVNADEVDGDLMRSCFKASHVMEGGGNHAIPLTKLRAKVPEFRDFKDAEEFMAQKPDKIHWNRGSYDYGSNFDGRYSTMSGTSPFTSYLLTHPDAVEKFYGMPMDGIRKGASSSNTDPAWAKWHMFVRNEQLESVGELGYLPIGFWQTIRLYDYGDDFGKPKTTQTYKDIYNFNEVPRDPQSRHFPSLHESGDDHHEDGYFHDVFEYFTVVGEDEEVRGRINLNAAPRDLLASAFYNMPIGKPDGRINSNRTLSETNAYLLATAITEARNNDGNFCFLSELGYLFWEPTSGSLTGSGNSSYPVTAVKSTANKAVWGEFERESIIRNSAGLFTTRGQTFLIIVRGESYSPRFGRKKSMIGGTSNASKTAIAQIWRDTMPDKNGKHPVFVKFFKIIDD